MTIINYASSIVNKLKALLTDNARVVIYDCRVFIVHATAFIGSQATNLTTDSIMNVIVESGLNAAYIVALYGCDRYYIEASSVHQVPMLLYSFSSSQVKKDNKLECLFLASLSSPA